jgi:hypothetical protein
MGHCDASLQALRAMARWLADQMDTQPSLPAGRDDVDGMNSAAATAPDADTPA